MSLDIAVIVGSLRAGSINRKLAEAIARLPAARDHAFRIIGIGDLPLYNQDDDGNPPAAAIRLKQDIRSADGVIFVSPEYNRSIPGILKNAIDHGSRPYGESAWSGKPAGIIGTSQGAAGTAMMQQHLRNVLAYLGMPTLTQPEAFIQWKDDTLAADGTLAAKSGEFVNKWLGAFLAHVASHAQKAEG